MKILTSMAMVYRTVSTQTSMAMGFKTARMETQPQPTWSTALHLASLRRTEPGSGAAERWFWPCLAGLLLCLTCVGGAVRQVRALAIEANSAAGLNSRATVNFFHITKTTYLNGFENESIRLIW